MMTLATVISAHIVAIEATILVYHKKYEDGFIGRIALVGLIISSLVFVVEGWEGRLISVLPQTASAACAFALFFTRHLYRFLRWNYTGKHCWPMKKSSA